MIARRTLLALGLLAGAGVLVSAPAQAGHERSTVIYQVGHSERNYCPPSSHRAAGHHYDRHERHWRHDRRYDRRHYGWEHSRYRGQRHYEEPHYRFRIEYHN